MKRLLANSLAESLTVLHEILLMVENDEVSFRTGCDWNTVKQNVKKVSIKNEDGYVIIKSHNGDSELKMRKCGSIASYFLKCFRDAFSHNHITYDAAKGLLSVHLKSQRKSFTIMEGTILLCDLQEIVKRIKMSKHNKK